MPGAHKRIYPNELVDVSAKQAERLERIYPAVFRRIREYEAIPPDGAAGIVTHDPLPADHPIRQRR